MKLACTSASFDRAIEAGELTQLEWLDTCARAYAVDGIVFEARHFPRTDPDYIAQLKKMATDLCLVVAGLACDELLSRAQGDDGEPGQDWLEIAVGLGAPVAITRAGAPTGAAEDWNALAAAGKAAAAQAKRRNVTVAVRNARRTLCASAADLKRLAKDVDSAWVRFALDSAALDPPEPLDATLPRTVIAMHSVAASEAEESLARQGVLEALGGFRGFLVVEGSDNAGDGRLGSALHALRAELARRSLAIS